MPQTARSWTPTFAALDFFAGSGLVTRALEPYFHVIWANDNSTQKAQVYAGNHGDAHFVLGGIESLVGAQLPFADLSWASFPCQDLSLAGQNHGIYGKRSGLVWEWLRVMDEMAEAPSLLVAENVVGLVSQAKGGYFLALHRELRERGYCVGAIHLDGVRWVPQSRPRIFIVAVRDDLRIPHHLVDSQPNWLHSKSIQEAHRLAGECIWWWMPPPPKRSASLPDIVEWDAPVNDADVTKRQLSLVPQRHMDELMRHESIVATGYKRTREGKQTLELRFDGVAGCLRTPKGGSSRQMLLIKRKDRIDTRLLTTRETARLMGAPDYWLPAHYNDAYQAMGDAVIVPAVRYLAEYLLYPLAMEIRKQREESHEYGVGNA